MSLHADVRAMRHFATWSDGPNHAQACTDCLGALLEGRAAYLSRMDPTLWRRGDVRALLYELAVSRLSEQCDLIAHTVPAVDAYLTFLDETDRLHPRSAAVQHLRHELAQHADGFPAAMADRSRFRMAKTLYQAMLVDGIRLDDLEAVDAWVARFNQAPVSDRSAVLEHLLAGQPNLLTGQFAARAGIVAALAPGHGPFDSRELLPARDRRPEVLPVFAAVAVPSVAEAAAAARRSALLRDLLTLARWLGQGRKATKDGTPISSDVRSLVELLGVGLRAPRTSRMQQVPHLQELFWLARQLELVDLRRTGLVAGPRLTAWQNDDALITRDDDEVLALWREVLTPMETGQEVPPEAPRDKDVLLTRMSDWVQSCLPRILVALYGAAALDQDLPVTTLVWQHVDEFLEDARSTLGKDDARAEFIKDVLRIGLCMPLDRLAQHGMLEFSGHGFPELDVASEAIPQGMPLRSVLLTSDEQTRLQLTPLGRWAMQETLQAGGVEAPSRTPTPSRTPR